VIRRACLVAIVLLAPLLVAASDPVGDVAPCSSATAGAGTLPDLVRADGWTGEEATTAVWRLTFAGPLEIPPADGTPFRIDILIDDPRVTPASFDGVAGVNRAVRYVARRRDTPVDVVFVPERGSTPFDGPVFDGNALTIQVPGRILLGQDEGSVNLAPLRWSVIVRDGNRCDVLGNGALSARLAAAPPPGVAASPVPSGTFMGPAETVNASVASRGTALPPWLALVLVLVVAVGVGAAVELRRRP